MEALALYDSHRPGAPLISSLCRKAQSGAHPERASALRALGCMWTVAQYDSQVVETLYQSLRSPFPEVRLAGAASARGPASCGPSPKLFQAALMSLMGSDSIPLLQAALEALQHASSVTESPEILVRVREAAGSNPRLRYLLEVEGGALASPL
jgi:hypothetical protein